MCNGLWFDSSTSLGFLLPSGLILSYHFEEELPRGHCVPHTCGTMVHVSAFRRLSCRYFQVHSPSPPSAAYLLRRPCLLVVRTTSACIRRRLVADAPGDGRCIRPVPWRNSCRSYLEAKMVGATPQSLFGRKRVIPCT